MSELVMISLLVLYLCSVCDSHKRADEEGNEFEIISKERIQAGKSKLEEFNFKARSSDCWRRAVEGIEKNCKNLGDIEQSYLAIDFANCHLSKSGRKVYSCAKETQTVEQCTGAMDDTTFLTYSTFFAHTANICFYLKSEVWQKKTEDTISKLSRTSREVSVQLEDSAQKQLLVLEKQNVSLENQKKIIVNEIQLTETLKTSTSNAKKAFEDMKQSAVEQRALFTETFDGVFKRVESIKKLQSLILGEFITLQSVAFYVAAVCTCYFFTSTPRTAGARLPLLIGLAVLISIERLLASWGLGDSQLTDTETIHARLWFCRKLFIIVAAITLMIIGYRYQDYTKINFDMLREIQLQIRDMKMWQEKVNALKAIASGESKIGSSCHSLVHGSSSWQSIAHPSYSDQAIPYDMLDTALEKNTCHQDDDESDYSYVPEDSELESFTEDSSEDEEHGVHERTPVTRQKSKDTPRQTRSTYSNSQGSRERVLPKLSPSHQYNLRSRRNTPSSLQNINFPHNMPSPSTFHEMIRNLQSASRRYTAVIRKLPSDKTDKESMFSSDEES